MTALRLELPHLEDGDRATQALTPDLAARLARLRVAALRCRVSTRLDFTEACALIGRGGAQDGRTADALLRVLGEGLGRLPVFFRPGAGDLSFDERWLVALLSALDRGDEASATFLLKSRIAPHYRRFLGFLAAQVATADEVA
ncbi:hypothetical protein [Tropicimonas sp. IMCC34011]|uniref:hypothetical protein n=1 Tax=Tropicimonas sp. IMCC34011 TaxID=2248759 RepID=UPI000E25E4FE|nr:hypothetical protein [Tropicimonas sp. IMCC34011]